MSLTYKTDSSFFMYVRPPGSYVGINILRQWFQNSHSAKFRLLIDQELDNNFASLKDADDLYPGTKTFAVVVNPWARMKIIYNDLSRVDSPISYLAGCDFETFILKLADFKTDASWTFNFSPLAPQTDWLEYTDDSGNLRTVDYIFTAENLEKEFKVIQDYFLCQDALDSSVVIPEYQSYYNNTTKNIIAKYFKKDIDKFNYTF
jgi:hypothetical protein